MANHRETNSYNNQVDKFTEALTTARKIQQDWLTYGLNFIHLYFEDVEEDWLENWGNEEVYVNSNLDIIKEFLVSDDCVAIDLRQHLGERSLFEIAVNLEECWRIPQAEERLTAIKHLLADAKISMIKISDLAHSLLQKLSEILSP